jgi:hypothetical protein
MDEIASESCGCLEKISDTVSTERFNMEIGLCMMGAASPYKKRLKKDYDIDFDEIDAKQGEELGRIIGLRMASVCPEGLMKMANRINQEEAAINVSGNVVTGQVTAINDDKFVEFSIRDEFGKISKYYWLTFIESDIQLSTEFKSLKDKFVQVHFITKEFFDARIGEYRTFNIIEKLIVTDN